MRTGQNPETWTNYYNKSSIFQPHIRLTLTNGALIYFHPNEIKMESFSFSEKNTKIGTLAPGGVVSRTVDFTITNYTGLYNGLDFTDAEAYVYLQIPGNVNTSLQRTVGYFIIQDQKTTGHEITLTGYDYLSRERLNEKVSFLAYTPNNAKTIASAMWGYAISNDFPNSEMVLPRITFETPLTKREILGYLAEICGCYFVNLYSGRSSGTMKRFPVIDYTSTLDGGTFWNDVDTASGGKFNGALSPSLIGRPYDVASQTINGVTFVIGTGTDSISVSGTATADANLEILNNLSFFPGSYILWETATMGSVTYKLYKNDEVVAECNSTTNSIFVVEKESDKYVLKVERTTTERGFCAATPRIYDGSQELVPIDHYSGWTGGDVYDGGQFAFWTSGYAQGSANAYPIQKIMSPPHAARDRIVVTGVSVEGENIQTVNVGTEGYIIRIKDNPLITTDAVAQEVAQRVLGVMKGVNFVQFDISWSANPILEPGDIIKFNNEWGEEVFTFITDNEYSLGNISTISLSAQDIVDNKTFN